MNSLWLFYNRVTGVFYPGNMGGPEDFDPSDNAPLGHDWIRGDFDPLSQRVDIATLTVVPYQPPPPPDTALTTYVWDPDIKRWRGSPTVAARAAEQRKARTAELRESDWSQLADAELTAIQKAGWVKYRKSLRDLPTQPGFPDAINWPIPPSKGQNP